MSRVGGGGGLSRRYTFASKLYHQVCIVLLRCLMNVNSASVGLAVVVDNVVESLSSLLLLNSSHSSTIFVCTGRDNVYCSCLNLEYVDI